MVFLKSLFRGISVLRYMPRQFSTILYAKSHEYLIIEGKVGTVGITNYAQQKLGDIVHIDLPNQNATVQLENPVAAVESVKAVSDIYAPITGEIIQVNEKLKTNPEIVNQDPEGYGWMWKMTISNEGELEDLLNKEQYEKLCQKEDSKEKKDSKETKN